MSNRHWPRWFCALLGHGRMIATERTQDHIAGTGWYRECVRCGKWIKLK